MTGGQHAEGCWGAHTDEITCAESIAWRAWSDKYLRPWHNCTNPDPRSWGFHTTGDGGDTCVQCGVKISELPRADPEDAPWRRKARGEMP